MYFFFNNKKIKEISIKTLHNIVILLALNKNVYVYLLTSNKTKLLTV